MKAPKSLLLVALLSGCLSAAAQKNDQKESGGNPSVEISALLAKHGCSACHHTVRRIVGPPFADISKRNYQPEAIVEKIGNPQSASWPGYPAMPALTVPNEEALKIAYWISSIAPNAGTEAAKRP
jgi:cytochrome c551/c552